MHEKVSAPKYFNKDVEKLHVEFFVCVLENRFTVIGMNELKYKKNNTIFLEYFIFDHEMPKEFLMMYTFFEGTWDEDPEQRKKQMQIVTHVVLAPHEQRNIRTLDLEGTEKWNVCGLPTNWRWQRTNTDKTLAAQAIHKIMTMAERTCIKMTSTLKMEPTAYKQPSLGKRNLALILAVSNYSSGMLFNTVRDGETLKNALENLHVGWEVQLVKNPTKAEAVASISAFVRKCEGVDGAVMVFFSGAGFELYGGSTCFVGQDTASQPVEYSECISILEICDMLKLPRSRSGFPPTIVVSDCCRFYLQPSSCKPHYLHYPEFPNLVQIWSTCSGHSASDGIIGGSSPFMEVFHKLIQTPGLGLTQMMRNLTSKLRDIQPCCVSYALTEEYFFTNKPAAHETVP